MAGAGFKLRYSYLICQQNKSVTSLFLRKPLFLLRFSFSTFWKNASNNVPKLKYNALPDVSSGLHPKSMPYPPPKKYLKKERKLQAFYMSLCIPEFPSKIRNGNLYGKQDFGAQHQLICLFL